jgi:hypothetical protein
VDLLITVATLFVAVYAIVPRNRQLDLRLRFGGVDWIVLTAGMSAILYLQFYEFFRLRGLTLSRPVWSRGITSHDAIYLVMLLMVIWLSGPVRCARLSRRKIGKFQDLAEELYWAGTYGQLFALLQQHLGELFRILHANFFLSRLRRSITPDPFFRMRTALSGDESATIETPVFKRVRSVGTSVLGKIARLLPSYEDEQNTARELVRTLFLSRRIVGPLATTRPYFALEVISAWSSEYGRFEFVDLFVRELLKDPASILYSELENNQNLNIGHRYYIGESNRFLYFFFSDAKIAHYNEVYRPVGDYVLSLLDQLARDPVSDPNCLAMDRDFEESGVWRSPLFAAIRFFDIMVSEALFQGVEWHMWLYYFPPIIEKCVRNYKLDDPLIEPDAEWPNRYSYLIYSAFHAMCDWISSISEVDPKQPNVVLDSLHARHENGNIPKSAILALSQSLRAVLLSSVIGDKFKAYLADMAFRQYFDLVASPSLTGYASVLSEAVSQGGTYQRREDDDYQRALIQAFDSERSEYWIKYGEHVDELERAILPD